jgi:hypothetical protein
MAFHYTPTLHPLQEDRMMHEHDAVIRNYLAHTRPLRQPPAPPPATAHYSQRPAETARLGIRCSGRQMHPAALRVLETTWRVWREPLE